MFKIIEIMGDYLDMVLIVKVVKLLYGYILDVK